MINKVQNKKPEVENQSEAIIAMVKNEIVANATQDIFDNVMAWDNMHQLCENITLEITAELMHATFMTEQLELTEKQKERLLKSMETIVTKARNTYLAKVNEDKRTKAIATGLGELLTAIVEEMLANLAKEVNRGALINCTAVGADTKSEKHNKIELHASKAAGDITIPTRCLLVSTNCLDIIQHSITDQLSEHIEKQID